jgi:hypothetical protein
MKRFAILACLTLMGGAVEAVYAARFVICTTTNVTGNIGWTDSPRQFNTSSTASCTSGDLNSCAWKDEVNIYKRVNGLWVFQVNILTHWTGKPCGTFSNALKNYSVGSAGSWKMNLKTWNDDMTINYDEHELIHVFP